MDCFRIVHDYRKFGVKEVVPEYFISYSLRRTIWRETIYALHWNAITLYLLNTTKFPQGIKLPLCLLEEKLEIHEL